MMTNRQNKFMPSFVQPDAPSHEGKPKVYFTIARRGFGPRAVGLGVLVQYMSTAVPAIASGARFHSAPGLRPPWKFVSGCLFST